MESEALYRLCGLKEISYSLDLYTYEIMRWICILGITTGVIGERLRYKIYIFTSFFNNFR